MSTSIIIVCAILAGASADYVLPRTSNWRVKLRPKDGETTTLYTMLFSALTGRSFTKFVQDAAADDSTTYSVTTESESQTSGASSGAAISCRVGKVASRKELLRKCR